MNCNKVKRLLPLLVGSEIPERKISSVKAHLKKCLKCQQEYDSYVLSLGKIKEWLTEERRDFNDREWQQTIQRTVKEGAPRVLPFVLWPFKKAWAYALMAFIAAAITLFVVDSSFIQEKGRGVEGLKQTQAEISGDLLKQSQQDVISMTIVSHETGLKIVWFFNKKFKLEE